MHVTLQACAAKNAVGHRTPLDPLPGRPGGLSSFGALGWRATVLGLGVAGFGGAGGTFLLARQSPEKAGLEPVADVPEQPSVTLRETAGYLRQLLSDADQYLLSVVFFAANGTVLTIIGLWGVPYLVVLYGLDVRAASYYTLSGAVGILVGAPTVGWVSDRHGQWGGIFRRDGAPAADGPAA